MVTASLNFGMELPFYAAQNPRRGQIQSSILPEFYLQFTEHYNTSTILNSHTGLL
jgi:hypothetical protein